MPIEFFFWFVIFRSTWMAKESLRYASSRVMNVPATLPMFSSVFSEPKTLPTRRRVCSHSSRSWSSILRIGEFRNWFIRLLSIRSWREKNQIDLNRNSIAIYWLDKDEYQANRYDVPGAFAMFDEQVDWITDKSNRLVHIFTNENPMKICEYSNKIQPLF